MITFALIWLAVLVIVCIFVPDKYLPRPKKRTPKFKNWHPDDKGGLPWFGNRKRARKNQRCFWDD